ncbi:MAG: glycosyltransferase family 39 protein [Pirellulaceae bacterium]
MKDYFRKHWLTLFWATVVFVVAILIRLPSCYESFWVDELHTAWAIWGDFGQVAERAEVGNQTPLYFQAMWGWHWLVGDSEVALRMSSVLAVAAASAFLVVGVKQSTGRLSAGVVSGAVLAVDSNSLFFGTEFRPYALVMLCSAIATWAAVTLLRANTKISRANLRLILVAATGVATLLHPTAIVTLSILACAVLLVALVTRQMNFKFQISDVVSLILIAAIGFALAKSSLGHSWEIRDQWAAFGKASTLNHLWTIWPWWMIAIAPGVIALLSLKNRSFAEVFNAKLPLLVAVVATTVFFTASYFDWVPLWHRRYFVAALPLFAWSIGACFALPMPKTICRASEAVIVAAGVFLIATMLWKQGTIQQWRAGQMQLVFRGEDWRGAVSWVNSNRMKGNTVIVDAGLIESKRLTDLRMWGHLGAGGDGEMIEELETYLAFPLTGPYEVSGAKTADFKYWAMTMPFGIDQRSNSDDRWVISRNGQRSFSRWLENSPAILLESKKFGNLSVFRFCLNVRRDPS